MNADVSALFISKGSIFFLTYLGGSNFLCTSVFLFFRVSCISIMGIFSTTFCLPSKNFGMITTTNTNIIREIMPERSRFVNARYYFAFICFILKQGKLKAIQTNVVLTYLLQ